MKTVLLEEKYILEYINDTVSDTRLSGEIIKDAKYHHNTSYKDAQSICKYGILNFLDLNKYGIRKDSTEFLNIMDDTESHVNGNSCVSLAVVGLTDLYPNEQEYDPFSPSLVDFLVDSSIKTSRTSIHYGNEFLCYHSINKEFLRSLDIRFLKLLKLKKPYINDNFITTIIQKYNYLRYIAMEIKKQNLNFPIREMSESTIFDLDLDKLISHPQLVLKK